MKNRFMSADEFLNVLSDDIPNVVKELLTTPEMQRLGKISMDCGCNYTAIPAYKRCKYYGIGDRLHHSEGVARVVWKFTHCEVEAVAALLHDIATPVFAHTIDFMNGDASTQESTEDKTEEIITGSKDIMSILKKYNIKASDVCDYHKYSIADNDSPMLSADRLEYTLENCMRYSGKTLEQVKQMYNDISVLTKSDGEKELVFSSEELAMEFSMSAVKNSYVYMSNEDRYVMQELAEIVKLAANSGVLQKEDLYSTEDVVINKLESNETTANKWKKLLTVSEVQASKRKPKWHSVKVVAKVRYINPMVCYRYMYKRLSKVNKEFEEVVRQINAFDMDNYLYVVD